MWGVEGNVQVKDLDDVPFRVSALKISIAFEITIKIKYNCEYLYVILGKSVCSLEVACHILPKNDSITSDLIGDFDFALYN